GFNANEARRQLLEEWQNVAALELAANDYITCSVNPVDLKNRFGDVEADCRNSLHVLAPPNRGSPNSAHIDGTSVPVEEPSTASKADICSAAKCVAIRSLRRRARAAIRGSSGRAPWRSLD